MTTAQFDANKRRRRCSCMDVSTVDGEAIFGEGSGHRYQLHLSFKKPIDYDDGRLIRCLISPRRTFHKIRQTPRLRSRLVSHRYRNVEENVATASTSGDDEISTSMVSEIPIQLNTGVDEAAMPLTIDIALYAPGSSDFSSDDTTFRAFSKLKFAVSPISVEVQCDRKDRIGGNGRLRCKKGQRRASATLNGAIISQRCCRSGGAPLFRPSRFSNIPPTLQFYLPDEKVESPRKEVGEMLRWCRNGLLPKVIRRLLINNHFSIVDEQSMWLGYWGRHLKSTCYKYFAPYQKINHFPGAFHIGRKDRLWSHIKRMSAKFSMTQSGDPNSQCNGVEVEWSYSSDFGDGEFDIMPPTFVLPGERQQLKEAFRTLHSFKRIILKPPASARGNGVRVVDRWRHVPNNKHSLIAQCYVDRPYLINGYKFDLRLYVYITSLDPLRIYLYDNGLVRFASQRYSSAHSSVDNRYVHLTNYSINKHFVDSDSNSAGGESDIRQPIKWTLKQLWQYLSSEGRDVRTLMERIVDVILKAIICCEDSIHSHASRQCSNLLVCHELFGFDILVDQWLRPWLLEVNISPSLHSGTELDTTVKAALGKDILNLIGLQIPDCSQLIDLNHLKRDHSTVEKLLSPPPCSSVIDYRSKPHQQFLSEKERRRQVDVVERFIKTKEIDDSIVVEGCLTSADTRVLVATEDEWDRRGGFTRVMPSPFSRAYLRYFTSPRYNDLLVDKWTSVYFQDRQTGLDLLERHCSVNFHIASKSNLI